jgi:hypothetical protein
VYHDHFSASDFLIFGEQYEMTPQNDLVALWWDKYYVS